MSKQIYVQAQADHIESLFKGTPLSAVEELVWNALDADANEVKVDVLKADSTFGHLGGSWKREGGNTPTTGRRLHGRHGRGRFRAFALGLHAEWRTTMRVGKALMSYRIVGEVDRPGVFHLDAAEVGPATGTEVYITGVRAVCDSLLDAGEAVRSLAARFALYLKSYPHVRIYFNGLPVTPVVVQKRASDYKLTVEGGQEAKLEVIEWKRKFAGSGRLILAGPDGFELHELPAGVRTGVGASFTAYLGSPRFPALHAENALVMDELNPEVRRHLDAARKVLKAHFLSFAEEKSEFETEWETKIAALSVDDRRRLLAILKRSLKAK